MSKQFEKPAVRSKTVWGYILTVLGVIGASAVAGINGNLNIIVAAIEQVTPTILDPMVAPAVTAIMGAVITWMGRQDAAESGKRIKGIFK